MDPLDRIDELIALIETRARCRCRARTAWSTGGQMIGCLDELRAELLRRELRRAAALLEERDKIIDAGRREAERIISRARPSTPGWCRSTRSCVSAEHEAARIIAEAAPRRSACARRSTTTSTRALANFEQFLTRSLASIERGRDKMHALREIGPRYGGRWRERPLPF